MRDEGRAFLPRLVAETKGGGVSAVHKDQTFQTSASTRQILGQRLRGSRELSTAGDLDGVLAGDSAQSLAARVEELMHQAKLDRKEALKLAAKERGMTRRAAYDEIVSWRDNDNKV